MDVTRQPVVQPHLHVHHGQGRLGHAGGWKSGKLEERQGAVRPTYAHRSKRVQLIPGAIFQICAPATRMTFLHWLMNIFHDSKVHGLLCGKLKEPYHENQEKSKFSKLAPCCQNSFIY